MPLNLNMENGSKALFNLTSSGYFDPPPPPSLGLLGMSYSHATSSLPERFQIVPLSFQNLDLSKLITPPLNSKSLSPSKLKGYDSLFLVPPVGQFSTYRVCFFNRIVSAWERNVTPHLTQRNFGIFLGAAGSSTVAASHLFAVSPPVQITLYIVGSIITAFGLSMFDPEIQQQWPRIPERSGIRQLEYPERSGTGMRQLEHLD